MFALYSFADFFSESLAGSSSEYGSAVELSGLQALGFLFSDGVQSAIVILGVLVQFIGFFKMCQHVHATKSVSGLSVKTIAMFVVFFTGRIASVLQGGYLAGDLVCALELGSLMCAAYLVCSMWVLPYDAKNDVFPMMQLTVPCLLLGYYVYGDINGNVIFDALWALSLSIEVVILLPQLWMTTRLAGHVERSTANFIVSIVLGRAASFAFWFGALPELAGTEGLQAGGVYLLLAHVVQLFTCADFLCCYCTAWIGRTALVLPPLEEAQTEPAGATRSRCRSTPCPSAPKAAVRSPLRKRSGLTDPASAPEVDLLGALDACSGKTRSTGQEAPPLRMACRTEQEAPPPAPPAARMLVPRSPCRMPGGLPPRTKPSMEYSSAGPFVMLERAFWKDQMEACNPPLDLHLSAGVSPFSTLFNIDLDENPLLRQVAATVDATA